jgi:Flp pilus assembly protein TadB
MWSARSADIPEKPAVSIISAIIIIIIIITIIIVMVIVVIVAIVVTVLIIIVLTTKHYIQVTRLSTSHFTQKNKSFCQQTTFSKQFCNLVFMVT